MRLSFALDREKIESAYFTWKACCWLLAYIAHAMFERKILYGASFETQAFKTKRGLRIVCLLSGTYSHM